MNQIIYALTLAAVGFALFTGQLEETSLAALAGAKTAVDLAIGLVGYMALFLGLFKIAEEAGLMRLIGRAIRPVMVRLFPDVPPEHPAMAAMLLNIAANMLGLVNAATPFGIKAMQELQSLNRRPQVATNAMVLFLALNTSGLALLPSGVVSLRASQGSTEPWAILPTTLAASLMATIVGVIVAKLLQRLPIFSPGPLPEDAPEIDTSASEAVTPDDWRVYLTRIVLVAVVLGLAAPPLIAAGLPAGDPRAAQLLALTDFLGDATIPALMVGMMTFGVAAGVNVYEVMVEGAKAGFQVAITIIPYLVIILAVVGMVRGSGAMTAFAGFVSPATDLLNVPSEVLPMAAVRSLSGSGAYGMMAELLATHGADSYIGLLSSTMQGSTDTTFYVLAVYFGAVGVSKVRHAAVAGVAADLAGFVTAVVVCSLVFGHLRG